MKQILLMVALVTGFSNFASAGGADASGDHAFLICTGTGDIKSAIFGSKNGPYWHIELLNGSKVILFVSNYEDPTSEARESRFLGYHELGANFVSGTSVNSARASSTFNKISKYSYNMKTVLADSNGTRIAFSGQANCQTTPWN